MKDPLSNGSEPYLRYPLPLLLGEMLDSEEQKLRLEGNVQAEAKLEDNLFKWIGEEDGEAVRSRVIVGSKGLEDLGK